MTISSAHDGAVGSAVGGTLGTEAITGNPRETPARIRRWNRAIVIAAVAVIAVAGFAQRWIADDGLIYVRAVEQILAGNGPVFNVGERAESSTGTLWQWLLVLAGLIVPNVSLAAVYLGLACTAAAIAFGVTGAQRLHGSVTVPAGVVVVLMTPPMWDFATSGLETGFAFAWIAGSWWLLVRSRDTDCGLHWLALVLGLGPLVRPDLALVSIVFLVSLWLLHRPRLGATLRLVAAAGALPVAYQVFRMGYYGVLVPLPAISKEASTSYWERGLGYLADLFVTYWLWVPAAVVLLLGLRMRLTRADRILVFAPVVAGALSTTYVIKVGGDFMHGRMLLPGLLLVMLPFFCLPRPRKATLSALCLVLAATTAFCVLNPRPSYSPQIGEAGIADERAFYANSLGTWNPVSKQSYLDRFSDLADQVREARHELVFIGFSGEYHPLAPERTERVGTVWSTLGAAGTITPLSETVIDQIGLSYPLAAHLEPQPRGRVGHEKKLPNAWVLADYGVPTEETAAARRALSCGALAELQESVRAPLTWSRFVDNFLGAFGRTSLRIPENPVEAERRFCG
ncbi:flagellar motor control protein ZomB [Allokutzneria multivorans]|uniref:Flagellar motor control protein ZomB n=1 Tax=Allokutzneria multivorans TaxID=1142134 RepID=A0ABP7TQW0_9PSEU